MSAASDVRLTYSSSGLVLFERYSRQRIGIAQPGPFDQGNFKRRLSTTQE